MRTGTVRRALKKSFQNRKWARQFGSKGTGGKRSLNAAEKRLVANLNAVAPNHADRIHFFDLTIGKKLGLVTGSRKTQKGGALFEKLAAEHGREGDVSLPKELQAAPLELALKQTFMQMYKASAMQKLGKGARQRRLGKIIRELYKKDKISFEGRTKVDFSNAREEIKSILGTKEAASFIRAFTRNLREETGWARYYIKTFVDPAEVLNKWG